MNYIDHLNSLTRVTPVRHQGVKQYIWWCTAGELVLPKSLIPAIESPFTLAAGEVLINATQFTCLSHLQLGPEDSLVLVGITAGGSNIELYECRGPDRLSDAACRRDLLPEGELLWSKLVKFPGIDSVHELLRAISRHTEFPQAIGLDEGTWIMAHSSMKLDREECASRMFDVGGHRFNNIIRSVWGMSFKQLRRQVRLSRLRGCLVSCKGQIKLSDLALWTGFKSTQNLSTAFRDTYGCTASEFARCLRNDEDMSRFYIDTRLPVLREASEDELLKWEYGEGKQVKVSR